MVVRNNSGAEKKKVTKNKCCSASGTPAVIVKCKKLNLVFCNNKLKFSLINVSRGVNFHATDLESILRFWPN